LKQKAANPRIRGKHNAMGIRTFSGVGQSPHAWETQL